MWVVSWLTLHTAASAFVITGCLAYHYLCLGPCLESKCQNHTEKIADG